MEAGAPVLAVEVDLSLEWDPGDLNGFTRVPPEKFIAAARPALGLLAKTAPIVCPPPLA